MSGMEVFDLKGKIRFCNREKLLNMNISEQNRQKRIRENWKKWRISDRTVPPPEKMNSNPIKPVSPIYINVYK